MKARYLPIILSLLTGSSVFAKSYLMSKSQLAPKSGCLDCFNFVAPSIAGADSINPAEIGLIVYDTSVNLFKGYTAAGTWTNFGGGSGSENIRLINTYGVTSLTSDDSFVKVDTSSAGVITVKLPDPASVSGKSITIKRIDDSASSASVSQFSSSDLIDGLSSITLYKQYDTLKVISDGTNWHITSRIDSRIPIVQKFTTPGTNLYYPTDGVKYIRVRMIGAGGGGSGSGTSVTTFSAGGGGTNFYGMTAGGGTGGSLGNPGAAGGSASLGSSVTNGTAIQGTRGGAGAITNNAITELPGGNGGSSYFGGGGGGGAYNAAGTGLDAAPNSGGGGGGAGIPNPSGTPTYTGAGGGSGGYVEAVIGGPFNTFYGLSVGAGGAGGVGQWKNGGNGADGFVEITEYFN